MEKGNLIIFANSSIYLSLHYPDPLLIKIRLHNKKAVSEDFVFGRHVSERNPSKEMVSKPNRLMAPKSFG
jgi:hypothetical protein